MNSGDVHLCPESVGCFRASASHLCGLLLPEGRGVEVLPILFPYVAKLGLLVQDHHAANYYRNMCRDNAWDKVVPVVQNYDSTDSYDIVINRW